MTKDQLKIVFFGTPEFAVESLSKLVDGGYNVVAVVTMPDKPAGRGQKMSMSAVKQYALSQKLPLLQPASLKDSEFISSLKALDADLFIVIAFRMLPKDVWQMPPLGTFNLHASLLPRYRGAAPINRAVMNGDTVTGVTTFFLKHEIDTGDIISQQAITIGPDENVGSVHDRLMILGADLTVATVDNIIAGQLHTIPQDELLKGEQPTPAPKIFKEDCKLDFGKSAQQIHNQVRGLSPYPGAWCELYHDGQVVKTIKVLETALCETKPKVLLQKSEMALDVKKAFIGVGDGDILELKVVQPAGKKPMAATEFLRGLRTSENGSQPCLM